MSSNILDIDNKKITITLEDLENRIKIYEDDTIDITNIIKKNGTECFDI